MRRNLLILVLGISLGLGFSLLATPTKPPSCGPEPPLCLQALVREVDNRGWVGFEFVHKSTPLGELIVSRVYTGSPAAGAGIQIGDHVVAIDGKPFEKLDFERTQAGIDARLRSIVPGQTQTLTVHRGKEELELQVTAIPYGGRQLAYHLGGRLLLHYPKLRGGR